MAGVNHIIKEDSFIVKAFVELHISGVMKCGKMKIMEVP